MGRVLTLQVPWGEFSGSPLLVCMLLSRLPGRAILKDRSTCAKPHLESSTDLPSTESGRAERVGKWGDCRLSVGCCPSHLHNLAKF